MECKHELLLTVVTTAGLQNRRLDIVPLSFWYIQLPKVCPEKWGCHKEDLSQAMMGSVKLELVNCGVLTPNCAAWFERWDEVVSAPEDDI